MASAPPASGPLAPTRRVLDPVQRSSEILFGLIMLLTFTGSLSVATSGRQELREMLVGALGCNLAWGIVDGAMYLGACIVERGRFATLHDALLGTREPRVARAAVRALAPEWLSALVDDGDVDRFVQKVRAAPPAPGGLLRGEDVRGAFGVFLLVVFATFPPVIPFLVVKDVSVALRISNGVVLAMLFVTGFGVGRATGLRPGLTGAALALLGATLAGITIALGG